MKQYRLPTLAVVCTMLTALPHFAQTTPVVSAEAYELLAYENHGDSIAITDCDPAAETVVIPSQIDGLPVTVIDSYAFYNCTALTTVTIPDTVTTIASSAFASCYALEQITLGHAVASIGDSAFAFCSALETISLPDSVKTLGEDAFFWCSGMTQIAIGASLTQIGDEAFTCCNALTAFQVPSTKASTDCSIPKTAARSCAARRA